MGTTSRSATSIIRNMLNKGAKGCEVIISGKLRKQRAKSMKYKDGFMILNCQPQKIFISAAVRHLELRQGIMGIKVKSCYHIIRLLQVEKDLLFLIFTYIYLGVITFKENKPEEEAEPRRRNE